MEKLGGAHPTIFCSKSRFPLNLASLSKNYRVILPSFLSIITSRFNAFSPSAFNGLCVTVTS